MSTPDSRLHVQGRAHFVDDLPAPATTLHGAVVPSPLAHGVLRGIDSAEAAAAPGVVAVLSAADVPGENQIGAIVPDEPLFADGELHFIGQPVALVVARSSHEARSAARLVRIDAEALPPVLDPREAAANGAFVVPSRRVASGDVDAAWARCHTVVEGRVETGAQEHVYLETQGSLAIPEPGPRLRLTSGTQAPTTVQRVVARVLGWPMHRVEVDVPRLGGAFGGKEDQANAWAALASVAAVVLDRPVKVVLSREEDMKFTGKRHPYSVDYKLGLDEDGRFVAYDVTYYQNSGAAADLSGAVMERSLFHASGSYFIPNARVTGHCCRTNLPPFTAFRGFGAPQAMFVMEAAVARAAEALGLPTRVVQERNLLSEGDTLPCGMTMEGVTARACFAEAKVRFGVEALAAEIADFNAAHEDGKRGLALVPVAFGISFTNTMLNQAGALVHVYSDGSVSVSTGAIEMGQGVNLKIARIVARTLQVPDARVRVETTNTTRVANTSPTAASTGADLNGAAAELAAAQIRDRLFRFAGERLGAAADVIGVTSDERVSVDGRPTDLDWPALVGEAYRARTSLSAQAFYATPGLAYDKTKEQGRPFAYHVYGTALVTVRLDVLRGTFDIERVRILHDGGKSLAPTVDRGQVEGAVLQGIGWLTMEEALYGPDGRMLTGSLTTYKIPDLPFAPRDIEVHFREKTEGRTAVMKSKAIGEPPLIYGTAAWFAVQDAVSAVRPTPLDVARAPWTHERVFRALHGLEEDAE